MRSEVRVLPDPPPKVAVGSEKLDDSAHESISRAAGAEACWLLFDNVDVASVLDELNFVEMCREAKVSPNQRTCIDVFYRFVAQAGDREGTCGYMVKRTSAHGGCLGGQRR